MTTGACDTSAMVVSGRRKYLIFQVTGTWHACCSPTHAIQGCREAHDLAGLAVPEQRSTLPGENMKKRSSAVAVAVAAVGASFAFLAPASASDQFTVTLNATVTGSCKFNTGGSNSTITIGNGGA